MSTGLDPQLVRLTVLLQLERRARSASREELAFVMVNETARLIGYRQAALWLQERPGAGRLEALSGVAVPDAKAPFPRWLARVLDSFSTSEAAAAVSAFNQADLPPHLAPDWGEWLPGQGLWLPLPAPAFQTGGERLGALVLFRDAEWSEADRHVLGYLAEAFGHALGVWSRSRARASVLGLWRRRLVPLALLTLVLALLFVPVRLSVLAPAEVTPRAPVHVRAPLDGVVDVFHVTPNQAVSAGQPLLSLDKRDLLNRLNVARKAYEVARAEYLQASQLAIADNEAKARVAILRGRAEQELATVEYVQGLLRVVDIPSPIDGVAVFDDPNEWLGRPVVVGQKILVVAEPEDKELEILLPVTEAIDLTPDAAVRFFVNVAPDTAIHARLRTTSYAAVNTPEAGMAFRLKATLTSGGEPLRHGLRGTAKLYGRKVPLVYYLFRRPLNTLRQWTAF